MDINANTHKGYKNDMNESQQLRENVHSELISDLEDMMKHAETKPDTKIVKEMNSLISRITTQRGENRGIPENENDERFLNPINRAMALKQPAKKMTNTSCQANACEDPD
eukprot:3066262-Rhodomonas_salina.1